MTNIIIVSHGELAQGLLSSSQMLIGENPGVYAVAFNEGVDMDDFAQELSGIISAGGQDDCFLILCDIKGGTPFNVASRCSFKNDKVAVIYGVNLPLLIEAVTNRDEPDFKEYVSNIENVGKMTIGLSPI